MSPKDLPRTIKKDDLMTKASREGVAASSSAMVEAGEESVRGEAVKDEKTKQSRDGAEAKSRRDEGREPSDDVPNGSEAMFSPKEHEDEDDDQSDDQDDDEKDADEDVKGRPKWLPTAFEVASDSGVKLKTKRSTTSKVEDEPKAESFAS